MEKDIKYSKFVIALCLFFFGALLQYIPMLMLGIEENTMTLSTKVNLTTFSNAICFIVLILMYRKEIIKGIKDLINTKFKPLSIGFNYWFVGVVIMILSTTLISFLNGGATSMNEQSIINMLDSSWLTIISLLLLAPVIEELVFRQSFKDIFKNKWIYLATSGLIFGALHIVSSPITSFVDYLYLIPYCSVGVAFSYMCYKTDNIMTSIIIHIMHNTINLVSTLLLAGVIIW